MRAEALVGVVEDAGFDGRLLAVHQPKGAGKAVGGGAMSCV